MPTRREALTAGGLMLAGLAAVVMPTRLSAGPVEEIRLRSAENGAHVWFDPVGLFVPPGTTIRWIIEADVHTATAYHPSNSGHALRIPEDAAPWDSGVMIDPGDAFEVTLTAEGVYDYFCAPHELAGMVGRIIVGRPAGPGTRPFDYFKDDPATSHWASVPSAARRNFPSIQEIMQKRRV